MHVVGHCRRLHESSTHSEGRWLTQEHHTRFPFVPVLHRDDAVRASGFAHLICRKHIGFGYLFSYSCLGASPGTKYNCVLTQGATWNTCTLEQRIPFIHTAPRSALRSWHWPICSTCPAQHSLSIKPVSQNAVPTTHSSSTGQTVEVFQIFFPQALLLRISKAFSKASLLSVVPGTLSLILVCGCFAHCSHISLS